MSNNASESDGRIVAWYAVAEHPAFADCHFDGTFLDAVLERLDYLVALDTKDPS